MQIKRSGIDFLKVIRHGEMKVRLSRAPRARTPEGPVNLRCFFMSNSTWRLPMEDSGDKIFNNDPIYMRSLVGKKVELDTTENVTYSGIVYVIDPIYKTIVLHTNWRSEYCHGTVFILFHAIKSLKVLKLLERVEEIPLANKEKKTSLKKWLKHMYIEVTESGDYLKIDDHLLIVPPYGPDNCISNNTIILDRVQKIINLMPPDFNPDIYGLPNMQSDWLKSVRSCGELKAFLVSGTRGSSAGISRSSGTEKCIAYMLIILNKYYLTKHDM
ncbi:hypothetical protein NQ317_000248 [Molorchus minor]|uniref:AD domain-containing protein n=1 Tax=Molorchus minor TaxID=1323400 RepID=A0ABQ9JD85_9CUCU|nr:hypothetical protein NQ317_000248 [Molorchus minor]